MFKVQASVCVRVCVWKFRPIEVVVWGRKSKFRRSGVCVGPVGEEG